MIYTVTFNPAIDYVMHTDDVVSGMTNRSLSEEIYFGGKGINVSLVLNELGIETKALGFIAGFTGLAIENYLKESGISTDFIRLNNGFSRINVKLKGSAETEINGRGPIVDADKIDEFLIKVKDINDGDTLVLSGSIPGSMPSDIYEKILERLSNKNIRIVVDATGDLLKNTLKYKPFLIKPNRDELAELFGKNLDTKEDVVECAIKLQTMGAANVLVSMAGDGAILVDAKGEVHACPAKSGKVINSVGAGDSMVAGFLAGVDRGYEYALQLGVASGGATAFSKGLATKNEIEKLMNE
ncbi:MAG: 1-phosphofructokinase [Clostridia bacterium]|nr:1-phosphofructokinase [Clostridia bacterium]